MTQISPGIAVKEIDLTLIAPALATSSAGTVGQFAWGPCEQVISVRDEANLIQLFGKPTDLNYADWFSVSSFLSYARDLQVVRAVSASALNASVVNTLNTAGAVTGAAGGTGVLVKNRDAYDAITWSSSVNTFVAKAPGALGNSLRVAWTNTSGFASWTYKAQFDYAPGTNEYHIIVIDEDGLFSGIPGSILEKWDGLSTVATARKYDGSTAYFVNAINSGSNYLWVGKAALFGGTTNGISFGGGADGSAVTDGERQTGWAKFVNSDAIDVQYLFVGAASTTTAKWVIDNVAEVRQDLIVFVSPAQADVVGVAAVATAISNITTTRGTFGESSYAVMDSNYKYVYDRYNDTYRWIPLNGDIAGLYSRNAFDRDPWVPVGGYTKGRIKGAVKLALAQTEATRDALYVIQANPVFVEVGEGAVLFGDKTLQSRPSAFDRANVRALFNILKRTVKRAAKFFLFEFNDVYTQNQFVNVVEPFLRDVKSRRGVTDFVVVCDETNNTPDVIARNEFVGAIKVRPNYSINFIRLEFTAVGPNVAFDEIVDQS